MATFIGSRVGRVGAGGGWLSRALGRTLTAVVTVLSAVLIAANAHGSFGQVVSVAFVLLAPAFAISGLLPELDGVVVAIVSAAGAVTVNALVVQTMLAMNAWSSFGGVVGVGFISAFLWLLQAVVRNGPTMKKG